jgi:hypothetical protein
MRKLMLRDRFPKMQAVGRTKLVARQIAIVCVACAASLAIPSHAGAQAAGCSLRPVQFDGFPAQELSNEWVKLDFAAG